MNFCMNFFHRRRADLEAKNPSTVAFRKFKKKTEEDKDLIPSAVNKTEVG